MPQPAMFGPDTTVREFSLHCQEEPYLEGGGVTVTLMMAKGSDPLTTYEVYRFQGYEVDYLGTLFDRLSMAWITSEGPRTLRKVFKATVKEAQAHARSHDSTR